MLKVGITGGIGSGKTTICDIFSILGIPVFPADQRAHWLMSNKIAIISEITTYFGNESYDENGHLNRAFIAEQVFEDQEKLDKLNQIVHPAVGEDYLNWCEKHHDAPYTLKEAAIMFESGSHRLLDKVITIWAPEEVRIKRVMNRSGISREDILERMENQWPEIEKLKLADFVIMNDGQHSIIRQVYYIHDILRNSKQ
jgi:dephospho-CoA kinase